MDGWTIDGWVDGQAPRWMDRQISGWMGEQMDTFSWMTVQMANG